MQAHTAVAGDRAGELLLVGDFDLPGVSAEIPIKTSLAADNAADSARPRPPTASWPRPNQFQHGLDRRCRLQHRQEPLARFQIATDTTSYRAPQTRLSPGSTFEN